MSDRPSWSHKSKAAANNNNNNSGQKSRTSSAHQQQQQRRRQQLDDDEAAAKQESRQRAWHDDDDEQAAEEVQRSFARRKQKERDMAAQKPSWATRRKREDEDERRQQRGRDEVDWDHEDFEEDITPADHQKVKVKDPEQEKKEEARRKRRKAEQLEEESTTALLRNALASTEPVLTNLSGELALLQPRPSSTIMLPQEKVRDLAWHPSSPLLCITTSKAVHTYHVSGKFTEKMTSWRIPGGKGLSQSAVLQRGEKMIVLTEGGYVPVTLELATGNVEALNFLDFRTSNAAVFAERGTATDAAPTVVATRPGDTNSEIVAVPAGGRMHVASIRHASLLHTITTPGIVKDAVFVSENEIACAVPNSTVLFFDIRKQGRCVRKLVDPSLLGITRVSSSGSNLIVGSESGIVSVYSLSGAGANIVNPTPTHSFKNLTTPIDLIATGKTSRRADTGAILFGSSVQQSAFRLAALPDARVVPRFPSVAMKHQFLSCIAFSVAGAQDPTVSVGEFGRVVNYAC